MDADENTHVAETELFLIGHDKQSNFPAELSFVKTMSKKYYVVDLTSAVDSKVPLILWAIHYLAAGDCAKDLSLISQGMSTVKVPMVL